MTSLIASLGFIPMAVATSAGAEGTLILPMPYLLFERESSAVQS